MIPPQKRAHLVSLLYQAHSSSKLLATREPDPLSSPRFSSSEFLSNCLTTGEPYIAYGLSSFLVRPRGKTIPASFTALRTVFSDTLNSLAASLTNGHAFVCAYAE